MSEQTLVESGAGDIWVDAAGENVELEAMQNDGPNRGLVHMRLTPGEAIRLSRALVAAAAEALGVKV